MLVAILEGAVTVVFITIKFGTSILSRFGGVFFMIFIGDLRTVVMGVEASGIIFSLLL